jgi:hypothetical protein
MRSRQREKEVERTRRQSLVALANDDDEFLKIMHEEDEANGEDSHTRENTLKNSQWAPNLGNAAPIDDGFDAIDEVVEDAIKIENNRGKAEKIVEAMVAKMNATAQLHETNDSSTSQLRMVVKAQSALLLALALVNLLMHSIGKYDVVCERSFFSTFMIMLSSFALVSIVAGQMIKPGDGHGIDKKLKGMLADAQSTLKLLAASQEGGDGDSDADEDDKDDELDLNQHALPGEQWREPPGQSFNVRGGGYLTNKLKVESAPGLFRLIAVDLIETGGCMQNICAHPSNRVARMKARPGADPNAYTFVLNFMIPGPPNLSYCAYWEVDKALINADTPFGRVAKPFFFGDDDKFRDDRFKFIPKVVEGNFAIRMAVKDTPTLMGHKLKQYYHRTDHYFELDVDISSSSVARNITGLVIGYAKSLEIDMAITIQGEKDSELPEVVMASCSAVHVDVLCAQDLE